MVKFTHLPSVQNVEVIFHIKDSKYHRNYLTGSHLTCFPLHNIHCFHLKIFPAFYFDLFPM